MSSSESKLKEKIQLLKNRRTGNERRQQMKVVQTQETKNKKKQKHVMRTLAKDSVRQVLSKFGIDDPKIEQEIMAEIISGHLTTPTQIAQMITRKMELFMPGGPRSQSQQYVSSPSAHAHHSDSKQLQHGLQSPLPIQTESGSESSNEKNDLNTLTDNSTQASVIGIENMETRKVLKHPSQNNIK